MDRQLLPPSAVCRVAMRACSRVSPRPRCSPKVRLRDIGDMHVPTRSPRPARPANVSGSAPRRTPSRAVSARPRVISAALVLSPSPMPEAIPQARAMTFFTAPPSSQPITSSFVYGRKYGVAMASWTAVARASSGQATTTALGCPDAISGARLGPVSATTRVGSAPVSSAMTSVIRFPVPSSIPFIRLIRVTSGPIAPLATQPARFSRRVWDGSAIATMSAPSSASAVSAVATMLSGSVTPGRYSGVACRSRIAAAIYSRSAHRWMAQPASASTLAKAVPQEPALITATCLMAAMPTRSLLQCGLSGRPGPQRRWRTTADLRQHVTQGQHDEVGDLHQGRRSGARSDPLGQVQGRPRDDRDWRAAQLQLVRARVEQLLRSPHDDRDDRRIRGQPEPRGAGLALHRPQVRLLAGGALG